MNSPARSSRRARVGLFEIDLGSGEVHKAGRKVPLQGQPFRVLALLLESPGKVVTRDELHSLLWPADTYVGFDEGLNTAIRKLRVALGDSAENPRFIETIARRGYRFIAPVHDVVIEPPVVAETVTADQPVADIPAPQPRPWPLGWPALLLGTTLLVVLAGGIYVRSRHLSATPTSPKRVMLAVLPFQNLSNDPGQEYFSDGLTEETITDLGRVSPEKLGVIARTSAMAYKHTDKTVSQIGRELGVDYILEGSVRRDGGKARVSAQLIRVSDQTHVWAQNYDRELHELIEIENELGTAIAAQVQANLTPQQQMALSKMRAVDPEAYDSYLKGRFFWNRGTAGSFSRDQTELDLQTAFGHFRRAIERDPAYALAYVGLADAYIALGNSDGGAHDPKEVLPQAKAAATKALELDQSLGEAHFALAQTIELYDWNWAEAEKEYNAALKLSPNFAEAHLEYGRFLQAMGRTNEFETQMDYAVELDPSNLRTREIVGYVTYASGRYDLAIEQFESLGDDFGLGWCYREKKMYPEAIAALDRSLSRSGRHVLVLASLADVYGLSGRKSDALKLIDELKAKARLRYVPSSLFALAYMGLGEKRGALTWMERAYEERDQGMPFIKADPGYGSLRSEPRFQSLLRRMNFPP